MQRERKGRQFNLNQGMNLNFIKATFPEVLGYVSCEGRMFSITEEF
jgi:hypothetical protein